MTLAALAPLFAVLAPLIAMPGIASSRTPNIREAWTFAAALILFGAVLSLVPGVLAGKTYALTIAEVIPGAPIALSIDGLGMLFALVSSSLWVVTSLYSIGYMRGSHEKSQTRFFAYFALSLFCAIGVAFSANLLTMYLFYELLSFATYPLVGHKQDADSRTSGRKYVGFIVGTSIGLALPAMIAAHYFGGDLTFGATPAQLASLAAEQPVVLTLIAVAMLFGFAKAALMPVHAWLPAAMVAPTPVSSLLHAVAVVKVGAFCIIRSMTGTIGVDNLLSIGMFDFITGAAVFTMIVASLYALRQDGLKARLAYSTIAQLAYITLGVGLLNTAGMTGGILHIAMHAFGKITLFFCAGAIYVATHEKYISKMTGIGRRMPWTMTAFMIGALSIIGIPPTGGFLSKWYLINGAVDAQAYIIVGALILSSLLNAAYFLPIIYHAWFVPTGTQAHYDGPVQEAPLACVLPPVLTAILTVAVFCYPHLFVQLADMAVATF